MGILLSWLNLLDRPTTTLVASSEAGGLGVRNLLTPTIAEVWRSAPWGASAATLDVDLATVQPIQCVAVAAPRDGLLPSAGATVAFAASAQAPINPSNLQPSPSNIVPGGGSYVKSGPMIDLGNVPGPQGASGARRLGSSVANGAGVFIVPVGRRPVVGGAVYEIRIWARSAGGPVTRGTVITTDEFNVATGGTSLRRSFGPGLPGVIDSTWREFRRTISVLSSATFLQIFYVEAINAGAEVEIADITFRRIGDALELAPAPLGLSPLGMWGWCGNAPISARYLRLTFTGTAADSYLQLGRAWAGPALVTARAAANGHAKGAQDPGSSVRAGVSGLRVAERGAPYRTARFVAPLLTAAEASEVEAATLAAGTTGQILSARHHLDLAGSGMFGAFAAAPALTRAAPGFYRAEIDTQEDL